MMTTWVSDHHERVGFALELATADCPGQPAEHLLRASRVAEELGFDAVFLPDHPSSMPDCWLHLAAIARRTERIRLGSGVACALYRHPVVLARLAADLDNLSGGRVILGIGAGWDAREFARLGRPMPPIPQRQAALEEAITIVRGVWGPRPFTYHGRYFDTVDAHVSPAPAQHPGPPLLVAGGGERVTLRQVARYADACQLSDMPILSGRGTADDLRHKLSVLRQHCAAVGRAYDAILRSHYTGWLLLAENAPKLRAKVERYAPDGLASRFSGEWAGFAMAATPEQAVAYYAERRAAGVQYFVIQTLDASDLETVHLLAEDVIPRVRSLSAQG